MMEEIFRKEEEWGRNAVLEDVSDLEQEYCVESDFNFDFVFNFCKIHFIKARAAIWVTHTFLVV